MTKAEQGQGSLWKKLLIEGPVIVISILLAFAIEAWWDEQQQAQVTFEQLARVAAELEANALRIEQKTENTRPVHGSHNRNHVLDGASA